MPFSKENIDAFLAQLPEEQREGASKMLNNPNDMSKMQTALHKANEEAKNKRILLNSFTKRFNLSPEEEEEVANAVEYINSNPDDIDGAFMEVAEDYGLPQMVDSGEFTEEDLEEAGLIQDEDTGEIFVDNDDGETYINEDGFLVDGNDYYVNEDGEYTDTPVHESALDDYEQSQIEEKIRSEYEDKMSALEEKEQMLELRTDLIKQGVKPDKVERFMRLYDEPEVDEITPEVMQEHIGKYKEELPQFFSGTETGKAPIYADAGSVNQPKVDAQSLAYNEAKRKVEQGDRNAIKDMVGNAPELT